MKRVGLVFLIILILSVVVPQTASADVLFSPFGGRVISWLPSAPGCFPLTAAICVATLGTICPNVEELIVGPPQQATLGIFRIDGATIPGVTTIYREYAYEIPGTWVLGNSINICNVCGSIDEIDVPGIDSVLAPICENEITEAILGTVCDFVDSACPVTNLVHKMGTGGIPELPL